MQQETDGSKMKVLRNILMTAFVLTISLSAQAQLKVFAPDSSLLQFKTKHITAETMSVNDSPVTFTYGFRNTGITNTRAIREKNRPPEEPTANENQNGSSLPSIKKGTKARMVESTVRKTAENLWL